MRKCTAGNVSAPKYLLLSKSTQQKPPMSTKCRVSLHKQTIILNKYSMYTQVQSHCFPSCFFPWPESNLLIFNHEDNHSLVLFQRGLPWPLFVVYPVSLSLSNLSIPLPPWLNSPSISLCLITILLSLSLSLSLFVFHFLCDSSGVNLPFNPFAFVTPETTWLTLCP